MGAHGRDNISTHSLTRRLTDKIVMRHTPKNISTHSLTRRLTVLNNIVPTSQSYFNSQPHKEADKMIVMSMDG